MLFSVFDRVPHMAHARLCANERARHVANGTEQTKRAKSQKSKRANKTHSTGPSHVVPHHSTTPARASLTSLFGWEAVILACMAVCACQRSQLTFIATTVQPNSQVKLDLAGGEL